MKTNFHTHNYRCGHARGKVEDYVEVAIKKGYTELGISDHAPMPDYYSDRMESKDLQGYLDEIENAQKKYKNDIKIYKSLEIEYFPECQKYYDELKQKLDYIVLGLHAFRYDSKDTKTPFLNAWKIKTEKDVLAYGKYMVEAIESGNFDYIAHPDLYMLNYRQWNSTTEEVANMICVATKKMNVPIEVNANGIRKTFEKHSDWNRYMYPYKEFWIVAKNHNAKVIIGSDAHDYEVLEDRAMELAREFCNDIGIEVQKTLEFKVVK